MQSGWRLYAVMIALAALTGTIVALALSGGPRLPSEGPRTSASATATALASPSRLPSSLTSPSPTPSAAATASPSATPSDPLLRIRPLVFSWRPTETTAIVEKQTPTGSRIIAVPLTGASATPLVDLPVRTAWSMRLDGSALALAVDVGTGTASRLRLAALSLQTGAISWVTSDEPTVSQRSPVWSNDGTVIYYAKSQLDGITDLGVFRVRPDGSNLTQLRTPTQRVADPVGLTPDGVGLVLSQSQAGGSLDILDLNTRVTRTYGNSAAAALAWRPQRPRALVAAGGGAGGLPQLVLWDDLAPSASPVVLATQGVAGADWDPTATRVVAAVAESATSSATQLFTMDANGSKRVAIAGTEGAASPFWLRAGVVYLWRASFALPSEVRLADPTGATQPKTLFTESDLVRLRYVSP